MKKIYLYRSPEPGEGGGGDTAVVLKAIKEQADTYKAKADTMEQKAAVLEQELKAAKEQAEGLDTRLGEQAATNKKNSDKIAEMEQKMATMSLGGGDKKTKSFTDALTDAFEEKKAEIETIVKSGGKQNGPLVLNVKAAITMSATTTIGAVGSVSHLTLTNDTGIVSTIRRRMQTYLQNVSVQSISPDRPYAMWIEELDEQGAPIFIAEGAGKTQLSVRYEEREAKAKKIAVYGKVTTEMLRYLPQLVGYIQTNMMKRVDEKTEDSLFNGDGTGNNLIGIISKATAFDGGVGVAGGTGLVGLVATPTNSDVIRALALQVQNSYGDPTLVWVRPEVLAEMDVEKDGEGRYLIPPFRSADGTLVAGIRLVPSPALNGTSYDFVGGDTSAAHVGFTDNATIQIGLDGNDFTNNLKTILVEQELVQYVSANDTQVLVKGTFAAAKAIIAQP